MWKMVFLFPCRNLFVYLVPVSIEDQQTGIISGLAGLQSLNSLSQFILYHLQTNRTNDDALCEYTSTTSCVCVQLNNTGKVAVPVFDQELHPTFGSSLGAL